MGIVQLAPRQLELFGLVRRPVREVAPAAVPEVRDPVPAPERTATLPTQTERRARELAQAIANKLGPEVRVLLTVHDNRSTMISFRRQPPLLKIRAHHMFLEATPEIVASIADYAGRGKAAAGAALDDFIARQQEKIRSHPLRPSLLEHRGQCFDLKEIFDRVNAEHFDGSIVARIGWGRNTGRRRRRSIRLGVYDHKSKEIRIHPALDRPDVPRFFVEFIVFHEMLHQVFPSTRDTGRHVHHSRAFRAKERAFPKYQAAMDWEHQHLKELLRR